LPNHALPGSLFADDTGIVFNPCGLAGRTHYSDSVSRSHNLDKIGGAGTFDGIFLTGILAVLLAGIASPSRLRPAR
jgi:hypothetical protein